MNRFFAAGLSAGRLQPIRFLFAGGINALFGYSIYFACLQMGVRPEVAIAVTTALGAIFNYATTARYVFGHRALDKLPIFLAAYGVIYFFNTASIQALRWFGLAPAVGQALLLVPIALVSFFVFRLVVFRGLTSR